MAAIRTSGQSVQSVIFISAFAILFMIILPVIVICLSPLFLYRWLMGILCPKFNPTMHKILSTHSVFYATSSSTKTPTWANIILNMKIEGKLNFKAMVSKLIRVGFASTESGEMIYPQFHQYCVAYAGFLFWKWEEGDEKIRIENHIRREKIPDNCEESAEDYVQNFGNKFLKTEFKNEQSPWEVIFLENIPKNEEAGWFVVFFKFHHSLADGCSIFNVMMNCVDTPVKMTLPRCEKFHGIWSRVSYFVIFPFKAAFDFAQVCFEGLELKSSPWSMEPSQMSTCRNFAESKIISIEMLKNLGDSLGVSVSAIVIGSVAGGIGRFLKTQNISSPLGMMCQMPVPIPNHPEGLTNSFSLVSLKLPIGIQNLEERLYSSEQVIMAAKSSLYSTVAFLLGHVFGSLPQGILKKVSPQVQPLQLSIFPGPRSLMTISKQSVLNMSYTVYGGNFIPVVITLLSYNNGIQIILNADSNLFPAKTRAAQNLIAEIEQEFDRSYQNILQVVPQA